MLIVRAGPRCIGSRDGLAEMSRQVRLDDKGECINNMKGHDGSMWIDIDGEPGQVGCLFIYEANDCRGYTAAWEFEAYSESRPRLFRVDYTSVMSVNSHCVDWCYEMPRIGDHTFMSYRYVRVSHHSCLF